MQSSNFLIRFKDKYKSFNSFHIRFAAIITLLGYSDNYKIRDLRKYILSNLRTQVTNSVRPSLYKDFVNRLRTYNLDIK